MILLFLRQKLFALYRSSLGLWIGRIIILLLFLGLGVMISLNASEGPDEVAHFYFSRFIAGHGRLPLNPEEQLEAGYKADLPPLFHLLVGLTGQGIDLESPPYLRTSRDNPRLQLIMGHENIKAWRVLRTEDPYAGEVLLWYWGRWFTLGCSLAGLLLFYILLAQTHPAQPWLVLGGMAVLAFLPAYVYISGVTSYEPLVGLLFTGYFLLLYLIIQQPRRPWLFGAAGLLLGLAALTRQTAWPILPVVPGLILWLAFRHQLDRGEALRGLALYSLALLLTFGSWLLYMAIYFNRVAEVGWFQGLISPIFIGDGSGTTSKQIAGILTGGGLESPEISPQNDHIGQWAWRFFTGLWGTNWLGWMMLIVWLVALAGLMKRWRKGTPHFRLWLALLGGHIGLFLFLPLVRFLFSGQASTAMSQHLLFPAGAAFILLLIYGLGAWLKQNYLALFLMLLAAGYFWGSLQETMARMEARWPIQTVPTAPEELVLATFGTISLISYESRVEGQELQVTLHWRAEEFLAEDYRFELTLLDAQNLPRSLWVGQPLNGRYPTRAWAPEDRVRDVIHLPTAGLAAGEYQLRLQLKGVPAPTASTADEFLDLGRVVLSPDPLRSNRKLTLGTQPVHYLLWPDPQRPDALPLLLENETVLFVAQAQEEAGGELRLKLVSPDAQNYEPTAQAGIVYNFEIKPGMASGLYRLRLERWLEGQRVAEAETEPFLPVQTESRLFTPEQPIPELLAADFAGYVGLLGYDLPQRRVQPGGQLPVTLYWQALRTIGADLILFNRLVDEKQAVWGGRDRVVREVYSTMFWAPGEIVTDPFVVQVATDAPDGIYQLQVGLYLPVGEAAVSLPLRQEGQLSDVSHVRLGPVKVGQTPAGLTLAAAEPQTQLNQSFGPAAELTLLGYDLEDQAGRSGAAPVLQLKAAQAQTLNLTLYWQVEAPLNRDYTTFVHVRNAAGEIVGQKDQPPLAGAYPTSLWEPGEIMGDEISLAMPESLAPGRYQIVIGLYHLGSGERLPIPGSTLHELVLKQIEVVQ